MKRRPRATERPVRQAPRNRARGNVRRAPSTPDAAKPNVVVRPSFVVAAAADRPIRRWIRRVGKWTVRVGLMGLFAYGGLLGVQEGYRHATTSPRFEVRGLLYQPTPHVSDERLRELMGVAPGTNILAVDLEGLAQRIAEDPWVARATVVRVLPDTLKVDVVEHEAKAVLLAGGFYLLDGEGMPFKPLAAGDRQRLPIITGIEPLALVQDPNGAGARIRRALDALDAYKAKERPRLSEIRVDRDLAVTLYTAEMGSELRLGRGTIDAALSRYDALRAALGGDAEKLAVAHLDGSEIPGRDRVVASFFEGREPPSFVADVEARVQARAQAVADDAATVQAAVQQRPRGTGRTSRLPRYE